MDTWTTSGMQSPAAREPAIVVAEAYYAHCRHDILAEVPDGCRRILSVGCGAGATEGELVRRGAAVVGIEMNPEAAEVARNRGVTVVVGDALATARELGDERFDCLIYADVLEHLTDPAAVLAAHVGLLNAGGTMIISVPNFRNYVVARDLFLRGHVHYTDAGIFDRTHLRVTTRRMVEEWLGLVGLKPVRRTYRIAMRRERLLNTVSLGVLSEFLARQVIVVARKDQGGELVPAARTGEADDPRPASDAETFLENRHPR